MGSEEMLKDEMTNIAYSTCQSLVKAADKCGLSRDYVAARFTAVFNKLIAIGTLEMWEVEEDVHGKV